PARFGRSRQRAGRTGIAGASAKAWSLLMLLGMASTPATTIDADRAASGSEGTWKAQLARRMRGHLLLTFIGTSTFIFVFFVGYFYVQQNPLFEAVVMPTTALDDWIPFQPIALIAYLSLWIYVGAGPGLQATRAEIWSYGRWAGALCVIGLA